MEHQTLGWWVVHPIDPATKRIILKIVGFQQCYCSALNCIGEERYLFFWKKFKLQLTWQWVLTHRWNTFQTFTVFLPLRLIWKSVKVKLNKQTNKNKQTIVDNFITEVKVYSVWSYRLSHRSFSPTKSLIFLCQSFIFKWQFPSQRGSHQLELFQ